MNGYEYEYDFFAFMISCIIFLGVCFGCSKKIILKPEVQDIESPPVYVEDKPPNYSEV